MSQKSALITLFLMLFIAANTNAIAQQNNKIKEDTTIYTTEEVEQKPEFKGGQDSLWKFIEENLVLPRIAREASGNLRVIIGFVVEADGSLSNFEIIQSTTPLFDEEALRVVKLMSNWIPAKKEGKAVRVKWKIPIWFSF
jgi:protein TonB